MDEGWRQIEPAVLRDKYSHKEREAMDKSDFGDPEHLAFPVLEPEDVLHAAERLHNAQGDQAEIKQRIIEIAKRKGFPLPQTWQEDEKKEEEKRTVDPENEGITASDRVCMYMGITRAVVENNDWIVEGQATSDVIDTYDTIFDYESSKKAFERWRGNVREQHDPKKAVGRGIKWTPDDATHRIALRALVSKGAPDTWHKVEDGVLSGFSVALKPGFKTKYVERNGRRVLCYYDFDYAEISLVDNPGSPGCDITVVRADGVITEVVDTSEENQQPPIQSVAQATEERAGARVSAETRSGMHEVRDHMLTGARKQMGTCNCDECQAMAKQLDPDNDGDIDLAGSDADTDNDAEKLAERVVVAVLRLLNPSIQRYHALAGRFAAIHEQIIDVAPIQRSLDSIITRLDSVPTQASLDEVRASLETVRGQVDKIAAQPAEGGPILNAADKRLATDPQHQQSTSPYEQEARILHELSQRGVLETTRQQTAAAAMMIRPITG